MCWGAAPHSRTHVPHMTPHIPRPLLQYNFSHYVNRFNGMPVNSGKLPPEAGANVAGMPNNFYFRFSTGCYPFMRFTLMVSLTHSVLLLLLSPLCSAATTLATFTFWPSTVSCTLTTRPPMCSSSTSGRRKT